jgi:hypothetical protein
VSNDGFRRTFRSRGDAGMRFAELIHLAAEEAPEVRFRFTSPTDPEPKIWAASPDENTPRGPNQAVRPIPGGHGTEGVPPSWSLHRVRASVWASRVQVKPPGAAGRRAAVVPAATLSPACAALWHPGRPPSSGVGRGGTRLPPAPVAAKL